MKRVVKVDLHGMLRLEAECKLLDVLSDLPPGVDTVEVIHGIGTGVLKKMVWEFYHHRIQDRVQCIGNPGQTNLYIKTT